MDKMADQTLEADGLAGFVPHFQSLNKHYVNVLNFQEKLSGSSLHVQQGRILLSTTVGSHLWTSSPLLVLSTVHPQEVAVSWLISVFPAPDMFQKHKGD